MGKRKTAAATGLIEAPFPGASDLPEFEGVQPVGVVTKIKGASQRITRAIHFEERGLALVEWKNDDISHKRTKKEGVKRHQTLDVLDLHEHTGRCPNCDTDLLAALRQAYRDANPQLSIDDVDQAAELGRALRTDESGVVMTPAEAEEALAADRAAVAELEAGRDNDIEPFDGYDRLGVGAIKNRLEHENNRITVLLVGAYEDRHKQRASVLDAVSRRSAQMLAEGK